MAALERSPRARHPQAGVRIARVRPRSRERPGAGKFQLSVSNRVMTAEVLAFGFDVTLPSVRQLEVSLDKHISFVGIRGLLEQHLETVVGLRR